MIAGAGQQPSETKTDSFCHSPPTTSFPHHSLQCPRKRGKESATHLLQIDLLHHYYRHSRGLPRSTNRNFPNAYGQSVFDITRARIITTIVCSQKIHLLHCDGGTTMFYLCLILTSILCQKNIHFCVVKTSMLGAYDVTTSPTFLKAQKQFKIQNLYQILASRCITYTTL